MPPPAPQPIRSANRRLQIARRRRRAALAAKEELKERLSALAARNKLLEQAVQRVAAAMEEGLGHRQALFSENLNLREDLLQAHSDIEGLSARQAVLTRETEAKLLQYEEQLRDGQTELAEAKRGLQEATGVIDRAMRQGLLPGGCLGSEWGARTLKQEGPAPEQGPCTAHWVGRETPREHAGSLSTPDAVD
ncbi:hypothetical protein FA13DRAFT_1804535 [Coprinellus micaceus]|uniref:Uncharacterized protein n=1 Tax=Coprinellus micaceus TaxID=71717 RepID=A0A4Y7S5Y5_COPMI|nr:hypothetical protein FA13DRAFT_1804535 [Coprinellus micaceus]